jgi:hypothetical protein
MKSHCQKEIIMHSPEWRFITQLISRILQEIPQSQQAAEAEVQTLREKYFSMSASERVRVEAALDLPLRIWLSIALGEQS